MPAFTPRGRPPLTPRAGVRGVRRGGARALPAVAGAVAGGLAVGVVQSLSALVLPLQMQNLVLFVVFIAVLALRPQGLLGARA